VSGADAARRADAEVSFDGADITESVRRYFISLTYTDNEEDKADDLQIKVHDREGIWLESWLGAAIDAAATAKDASAQGPRRRVFIVTAEKGAILRSKPSANGKKLGTAAFGTQIEATGVNDGWVATKRGRSVAYVSSRNVKEEAAPPPDTMFRMQATIIRRNWRGDGIDGALDCGQFELDAVTAEGPPSAISIKGTSLPYTSGLRTERSKAWESCSLSAVAAEIAGSGGMAFLYESKRDPKYKRLEQVRTSGIEFLQRLCRDAGMSLKATNNILVVFDQADYEAAPPVLDIRRGDGSYAKWRLLTGSADSYDSCRVSCVDPATGRAVEGFAYAEGYSEDNKDNRRLEVAAKVGSIAEAEALAGKRLRLASKYGLTASFTLPGNPALAAGCTVRLAGWGSWDGIYIISQAKHEVGGSGYTTQIALRRALEGL
jgi:phage protein D